MTNALVSGDCHNNNIQGTWAEMQASSSQCIME